MRSRDKMQPCLTPLQISLYSLQSLSILIVASCSYYKFLMTRRLFPSQLCLSKIRLFYFVINLGIVSEAELKFLLYLNRPFHDGPQGKNGISDTLSLFSALSLPTFELKCPITFFMSCDFSCFIAFFTVL